MSSISTQGPMGFWRGLDHARALLGRGPEGQAEAVDELTRQATRLTERAAMVDGDASEAELIEGRRTALTGFLTTYGLALDAIPCSAVMDGQSLPIARAPVAATRAVADKAALSNYIQKVQPGLSLVTCCKNRNENLIRALPSWLAVPGISEIVIVDWSSDMPVAVSLRDAGLVDPRIVIARVEDEPRWILSYAFNLGFRVARHATILKVDADIVLRPDFTADNPPQPGRFRAGNWRNAANGQEYINGVLQVARSDLMAVQGFNEFITTYGWDDDDLYERLMAQGLARTDITPASVHHLDHDDAARLDQPTELGQVSAWAEMRRMPLFKTRSNRFLATLMPPWDGWRVMLPYRVTELGPQSLLLRRTGEMPHLVPDHLCQMAETLAATEMLAWRAGLRVYDLMPEALQTLLQRCSLSAITALQVELMLAQAAIEQVAAPQFLIAELNEVAVLAGAEPLLAQVAGLTQQAAALGRVLVVQVPKPLFAQASQMGIPAPLLPSCSPLGHVQDIAEPAGDLTKFAEHPVIRLKVAGQATGPLAAPEGGAARARIFVDGQHGLGNRMRAIGSADAIARATDRELVVVWQPDHHCQGRMSDLFDYNGAVIEESFVPDARAAGLTFLNYMEMEADAVKDAPLLLEAGRDAYLRSAFVIKHPASNWDSENLLLRGLQPNAAVRALMADVPDHRDIALHVRMEGAAGTDTNSYDSAENWRPDSHEAITHWREKSHYRHFLTRLDKLLLEDPGAKLFLAADLPDTYRVFSETYGNRLAWLERSVFDRSALQLQYALADIALLARCTTLLGSNWSSFSEVALRMSNSIHHHEMSGIDF
jgi:hypothetical protein